MFIEHLQHANCLGKELGKGNDLWGQIPQVQTFALRITWKKLTLPCLSFLLCKMMIILEHVSYDHQVWHILQSQ